MKKLILLTAAFYFVTHITNAQPGAPDRSYGNNGIVITALGASIDHNSSGRQVMPAPGGSAYIVFDYPTTVSKRFANGSIDSSYGFYGYSRSVAFNYANATLQKDGKILIVGYGYNVVGYAVARLNINGNLDSSFGNNGIRTLSFNPRSVAGLSNGKIVVTGGGQSGFLTRQYNSDGSLDTTFNKTGQIITDFTFKVPSDSKEGGDSEIIHSGTANTIVIQPDGKIIVGGAANSAASNYILFAVARYNTDGTIDSSFNGTGGLVTDLGAFDDIGYSLVLQKDGKIVLAGYSNTSSGYRFSLARYNVNGSIDKSFNNKGSRVVDFGSSDIQIANTAAIQSDGKIVIAGYTLNGEYNDFAIARINTNGSQDKSFNVTGLVTSDINSSDDYAGSVMIQSDGKILVAGTEYIYGGKSGQHFALARYNTNGSPDVSFSNQGKLEGDFKQGDTRFNASALQSDGKLVAAGQTWNGTNYDFAVVRYNVNGTPDTTFSHDGLQITDFGSTDDASALIIQPDGKIVVGGDNETQFAIARYNTDGSPDKTFNGNGTLITSIGFSALGQSVALQSDGKIVMAGYAFIDADYDSAFFAVARYNANGTLDNTFGTQGKQLTNFGSALDFASSVVIQKDGKIIVAGRSYLNGRNTFSITRYKNDGSPDTTFSHDRKQNNVFGPNGYNGESLALQADGKIVLAGYSQTPSGSSSSFTVARYNGNGILDTTFSDDGFQITNLGPGFNFGTSVAISSNGKIAVGGTNDNFAVVLYKNDGSLDSTFGDHGIRTTNIGVSDSRIQGVAILNNKLYAAGFGNFPGTLGVVARFFVETNNSPTISLTTPANNATYTAPANITLNAAVSVTDDIIKSVQFYNNGILLFTDNASPYTYTINNAATGTYLFTAKATTSNGLSNNSASATVSVLMAPNKAPIVNITDPVTNTTYTAPAAITINATASDSDGTVTSVKFYNGSTLLATDSTSPYSYTMNNVSAGIYKLYAQATDNQGLKNTSSTIFALVAAGISNKFPSVNITSPVNNANYHLPATIVLHAAASDTGGAITSVDFYNGSTLLKKDSTSPYSCTISNPTAGSYSFVAKAVNNSGLVSNSSTVNVQVGSPGNKAPAVNMNEPVNNSVYTASSAIILKATAADSDGSISSVKFYDGSTLLKTVTSAPYNDTIANISAGIYKFFAKATDNSGLVNSSATASVFVVPAAPGKAPLVKLITPVNNTTYYAPGSISMSATASDIDGTIENVKFYLGSTLLATDSTSPYSYTATNVAAGSYSITAKAINNKGVESNSQTVVIPVSVSPNKAPVINLSSPANNAGYVAPASVTLSATASDPDGTISSVKFFNGSTLVATDSISPYTYTINNIAAGSYKFYAKATDNKGLTNTSATSTIIITAAANKARTSLPASKVSEAGIRPFLADSKAVDTGLLTLTLAPNPVRNILYIYINGLQMNKQSTISLISSSGVILRTMKAGSSAQVAQLNVSSFTGGMYILKILSGDKVVYRQFVKM